MPTSPIPDHVGAMLAKPNPAVIATLRPDGAPHSVATWYLWEGGRVLVNMDASRVRLEHLRRDPRVALTVLADGAWYQHVSLRGRVVSLEPDEDHADIDRLSRHYGGQPYPNHRDPRVSAWIEVTSWHGWQI
jgi:PPOX class probable F420-dependent enzyme